MKLLGNILWFLFGGLFSGVLWIAVGVLWCVTIVGIPIGLQCFKFAGLAFWPFGKEIQYTNSGFKMVINVIWILASGMEMAIFYLVIGGLWCITVVGIPFGMQFFKMAKLAFMPFGANVV